MTGETILIAALAGRALAASARRAGFTPLVVDAFGDEDTRAVAASLTCLPEVTRTGFRARPLLAALERMASGASRPPVGLVLGSGFEDTPKLVSTLARHFPLIGNDGAAIARAKDPASFFPLLDELAIPHPETRLQPPSDPVGWLSKRIGGSGGAHVVPCAAAKSRRRRYYQLHMEGTPVSLLAVAGREAVHIAGLSRQWTTGGEFRPYRYGGATGPIALGAAVEARMIAAARTLCRALGLIGLVSFDFLLAGGNPHLLEVNPRPGATLDVFDDPEGSLFRAHVAAWQGRPIALPPSTRGARSAGVLYADPGTLVVGPVPWPAWSADRPSPGTRVAHHRPLATVFAGGANTMAAEQKCRRRLDELAQMLYSRALNRERTNAEVRRARPERLGTSGQAR